MLFFLSASVLAPLIPAIVILLVWLAIAIVTVPVASWEVQSIIGTTLFVVYFCYFLGGAVAITSGLVLAILVFLRDAVHPAFVVGSVVIGSSIVALMFKLYSGQPVDFSMFVLLGAVGILSAGIIFGLAVGLGLVPGPKSSGRPQFGRSPNVQPTSES